MRDDELYVVPVAFGDPVQITYGARGTGKVGSCISGARNQLVLVIILKFDSQSPFLAVVSSLTHCEGVASDKDVLTNSGGAGLVADSWTCRVHSTGTLTFILLCQFECGVTC